MRYSIIAIEREYGSGGREVGEKLAEKLGLPCYGHEILEKASVKLGMPVEELRIIEESVTGSFLFGVNMLAGITSGRGADLTVSQKLVIAETEIIRELSVNPCVIIGRSAAGLLKDNDNALKVFIHADIDARTERAVAAYRIEKESAESVLRKYDKRRADYFKIATGVGWQDPNTYHMMLNSGKLGINGAVEVLCGVWGL